MNLNRIKRALGIGTYPLDYEPEYPLDEFFDDLLAGLYPPGTPAPDPVPPEQDDDEDEDGFIED